MTVSFSDLQVLLQVRALDHTDQCMASLQEKVFLSHFPTTPLVTILLLSMIVLPPAQHIMTHLTPWLHHSSLDYPVMNHWSPITITTYFWKSYFTWILIPHMMKLKTLLLVYAANFLWVLVNSSSRLTLIWFKPSAHIMEKQTWMAHGSHLVTLHFLKKHGQIYYQITLIKKNCCLDLNMVGICLYLKTQHLKMLHTTIIQLMIMQVMLMLMLTKNYNLVLWLVLSLMISPFIPLSVHLAQLKKLTRKPGARSQIAASAGATLFTESTTGFQYNPIEAAHGRYISPELKTLFIASPESEPIVPATRSKCSNVILAVIIDGLLLILVKRHSWPFPGEDEDSLIDVSALETELPCALPKEQAMPSPGSTEPRSLHLQVSSTLESTAAATLTASAVTIQHWHTLMTSWVSASVNQRTFSSSPSSQSSKNWGWSCQKPRVMFALPRLSALDLELSLIFTRIQFRSPLGSSHRLLVQSTRGSLLNRPQEENSRASVVNSYIAQESSLQVVSCSTGCWKLSGELNYSMNPFLSTPHSSLTFCGGETASPTGMDHPSSPSIMLVTLPLMPAEQAGSTKLLALGVLILKLMNISKPASPLYLPTGTSMILSSFRTSSLSSCGERNGLVALSLALLITNLLVSFLQMGSPGVIVDWRSEELSPRCNIECNSDLSPPEFLRTKTHSLTCCQDGTSQGSSPSSGHSSKILSILWNAKSLYKCLTGYLSKIADFSREFLSVAARILQGKKWAPNTVTTINSQQRLFLKFCSIYKISHLPVTGPDMVLYSAWLMLSGHLKKHGSLMQYLSAVNTLMKQVGLPGLTPSEYPPLQFTCDGIRRAFAAPTRQSLPITPPILMNFLNSTLPPTASCTAKTILTTFKSLCIVYFFSLLRTSNLIPASPAATDSKRQLTWGKIRRFEGGIVLRMTLEKTIQFEERVHEVALSELPGSPLCPVAAITSLMEIRGRENCHPDSLVFQLPIGSNGWRPLVRYEFDKWFKMRISQMGLPKDRFFLHSWRHGGIHQAILSDSSLELIRISSNHLSSAIYAYSRIPAQRRFSVCQKMLDSF